MVDEKKERIERHEDPSRTGSAAIKGVTAIVITLLVLGFLIFFVFPMFGDDDGGGDEEDVNLEVDMNEDDSGDSSDSSGSGDSGNSDDGGEE